MSGVVTHSAHIVQELRDAGLSATNRPSAVVSPGVLVEPVPVLDFDGLASFTATWRILCLVPPPADLRAAEQLEHLVGVLAEILPIQQARPASFRVAGAQEPSPAYLCTYVTTHTKE